LTALPAMAQLVHVIHSIPDQRALQPVMAGKLGGFMQTVLLIENDPANLVAQALVLRSFGFTLLEARSRGEAWRACHRHQGPIHLVVAKAILDNHRTSDFIARLRLVYPQICALILSETSSAELADNQSMPCEFAFLQKPFRLDTLGDTIRKLLDGPKKRAVSSIS
jgi:two-component system, cell cycle sensor histidine kinase and response regulator CckA